MTTKSIIYLLTIIGILPVIVLIAGSLIQEIPHFFDPCYKWEYISGTILSTNSECSSIGSTSETMLGTIMRLLIIQGGLLIAVILGIIGAVRLRSFLLGAAAIILFLESLPLILGGIGILTFLSGASLLTASILLLKFKKNQMTKAGKIIV